MADLAASGTLTIVGEFRFRSRWRLPASPDTVYAVLADVAGYPLWWPQIRSARPLGDGAGELTCRSLLPYDLTFAMRREIEDPAGRVLRARLEGDLVGISQWTIDGDAAGTIAVFDEEVDVAVAARPGTRGGLVRAAGRLARPALRYNHDHMMRSGERGLRQHLSARAE
ncbi:MAG TPA: SRPBCC family protein [Jatrophihabitans sp.]|nr:SRPBCC family protein [Jatrophihabitans sp.]